MSWVAGPWPSPPNSAELGPDDLHVWFADLDVSGDGLEHLECTLSVDERDRANRFCFDALRRRFVAARGLLRVLLGRYLREDPSRLEFHYGNRGKPTLTSMPHGGVDLRFNVAHSEGHALYALTRGRDVGVDLEHVHSIAEIDTLADRCFSPAEQAAWRAVPGTLQMQAFFNGWTRKEAFIKAVGEGLSYPLDRFTVSLAPGEPARLLRVDDDPLGAVRWRLHDLQPHPSYSAALVVEGGSVLPQCWALRTADIGRAERRRDNLRGAAVVSAY